MNALRPMAHLSVLAVALLAILFLNLHAQQLKPPTISYEGQKVSSVELAGRPDLNVKDLKELVTQHQGAPYLQKNIDESVAALEKTGQFTDVQLDVRPQSNGLEVLLVLQPAMYFGVFDFGNATRVFSYNRLLQLADYPNQRPYTAGRVETAESNLLTYFHQTGFFQATIEPKLQIDQAHGIVNVLFDINLKRRAKVGRIILTGASEAETARLQQSLRSIMARLRGVSLRPGMTYTFPRVEKASNHLQAELAKRNYLAGHVQLISALYNPETNKADITFQVTQGPQIGIRMEGASVRGRTMKKLIPVYQENTVDPDLVEEGSRNLVSYFQSKGFFKAKVHSRIEQKQSGSSIVYQVEKGPRGKVESIDIQGNHKFDDDDLAPHLAVARKRFLSRGKFSQQLLRKSVKNLEGVYQNAGYSQVKVTPTVKDQQGNISIVFQVDEGAQDMVYSLKVEGNKTVPETEFAPGGLSLEPGRPFSLQLLDKDRDLITAWYLTHGYLTANFRSTSKALKDDPHKIAVVYTIQEGPQVHTASVHIVGARHTRQDVIGTHANIKTGQPLSADALLKAESNMYTLGVFDWASVDPQKPITTQSDSTVLIKLHEAKRNAITYGFGFEVINRGGSIPSGTIALPNLPPVGLPSTFKTSTQTFWGPRGSMEYSRLNFRGRGETVTIGGLAARLDQRAAASWLNPSFWNSSWSTNLIVSAEHSTENPIFAEKLIQAGYQFQRSLDAKKTKTIFLRYSLRRTNLSDLVIPDLVSPQDQRVRLSTLAASYIRDTRDNSLDAHRGIYQSAEFAINPKVLGSNTNFVRFLGQTAYYRRLGGNNIIWANSFRLGLESAFPGDFVPLSEEFFSGGGSTLRGFPLNGAGPQRNVPVCSNPSDKSTCSQITVPLGGTQLVILNSELRFPIPVTLPLIGNGLGAVAFYDGGNVYTSVGVQNLLSSYTNTVGGGLRYATPIGPIRLDIGHRLTNIPGVSATQIFITVGQAF